MTLTRPTDQELSAAVAAHVARWAKATYDGNTYWHDKDGDAHNPEFATSADAVIPLLDKHESWSSEFRTDQPEEERHSVCIEWTCMLDGAEWTRQKSGEAPTFSRAACIALLRAHGVEVVT